MSFWMSDGVCFSGSKRDVVDHERVGIEGDAAFDCELAVAAGEVDIDGKEAWKRRYVDTKVKAFQQALVRVKPCAGETGEVEWCRC